MIWAKGKQLALLDDPISVEFAAFHQANPHVYETLRTMALDWIAAGHAKFSMGMAFEVLRWQHGIETTGSKGFRLDNDHRAEYARLLMANEADLVGRIPIRQLRRQGTWEEAA